MRSVTFLELTVTIIIIAILATFALAYSRLQVQRSQDSEAQTNLALIIGAERDYRRQMLAFYVSNSPALLNTNLDGILLPAVGARWAYSTEASGTICCAQAGRTAGPARTWRLCCNEQSAVLGTCGANAANCPAGPCI